MYGMKKTTIYLPDDLKAGLQRAAETSGQSEAELIREAVGQLLETSVPPKPRLPLFASADPGLAQRVAESPKEELAGFGER